MTKAVQLKQTDGADIYVVIEQIIFFEKNTTGSRIWFTDSNATSVTETPADLMLLINDVT